MGCVQGLAQLAKADLRNHFSAAAALGGPGQKRLRLVQVLQNQSVSENQGTATSGASQKVGAKAAMSLRGECQKLAPSLREASSVARPILPIFRPIALAVARCQNVTCLVGLTTGNKAASFGV